MVNEKIAIRKEVGTSPEDSPAVSSIDLYAEIYKCLPNSCLFSIIPKHVQDQFVCPSATQCSDSPMTEPDESLQLTSYDSYLQDVDDHFEDFFHLKNLRRTVKFPCHPYHFHLPSYSVKLTKI